MKPEFRPNTLAMVPKVYDESLGCRILLMEKKLAIVLSVFFTLFDDFLLSFMFFIVIENH